MNFCLVDRLVKNYILKAKNIRHQIACITFCQQIISVNKQFFTAIAQLDRASDYESEG